VFEVQLPPTTSKQFPLHLFERTQLLLPIAKVVRRAFGSFGIRHIIEQPGSSVKRLLTPTDVGLFSLSQAKRCVEAVAVQSHTAAALVVDLLIINSNETQLTAVFAVYGQEIT
jgi:hypothetical protein